MKLISFLGTGNPNLNYRYQPTTYQWQDKTVETEFFPEAILKWLPEISKVYILLTEEAGKISPQNNNWVEFSQRMSERNLYIPNSTDSRIQPVDIKTGRTESEIWEIFDTFLTQFADGEEVVLDITHAFRSLPVFGLLASIFMQSVGKIKIRHILYGAFEGKAQDTNITPVFDLSPFVSLIDWSQAASQFIETGISKNIGLSLEKIERDLKKQYFTKNSQKLEASGFPSQFSQLGKNLSQISDTLLLTQPRAFIQSVSNLENNINSVNSEAEIYAKPFSRIQEYILEAYRHYQEFNLNNLLDLLNWYIEHKHYVQAITLAREWLVCLICQYLTGEIDPNKLTRNEIELICAGWSKEAEGGDFSWAQAAIQRYQADAKIFFKSEFISAWSQISSLRNDVAHCYMARHDSQGNPDIPNSSKMIKKITDVVILIKKLPIPI